MKTLVLYRGPANFDMCGKLLGYPLEETKGEISNGTIKRLTEYANNRARNIGIYTMIKDWDTEIYTMDGDEKPANRSYNFRWKNSKGAQIELCQILTRNGWPFIDHRFSMNEN